MNKVVTSDDVRWNRIVLRLLVPGVGAGSAVLWGMGIWLGVTESWWAGAPTILLGFLPIGVVVLHIVARIKCGDWGFKCRMVIEELGVDYEADSCEKVEAMVIRDWGSLENFDLKLNELGYTAPEKE